MNNLFVNQDASSEILVSEEQSTQDLLYNGDKSEDILAPVQYEEYGLFAEHDNLKYIPLATKTTYGIVKIGDGLEVVNGVLNVIGGGSSDITKLSQLENDVGFITGEDVVTLSDTQIVQGIKIFTETIGLLNTDGTLDRIRHINNNFLIVDQNGTALLDIDEGFKTIKSFGKELAFVEDIPDLSDVPTKVSDLINDTGFITNTVDNLVNYYIKTEQYTKEEINELVSKIPKFDIEVIDDPNNVPEEERSETTIYLVPRTDGELNDYYDELIWIHNAWERLGSTKINLSNYYTKTDADKLFLSKTDANSTFAKLSDIPDVSNFATKDEIPTDYAKLSDIKTKTSELINDSGFIDKDVSNLTQYYTIAETSQLILDNIPTQLSQLATDTNNQRVSVSEKTKWNNKSDFGGSYNDLTNKPDLSKYLHKDSTVTQEVLGPVSFKNLQIIDQAGGQPTYINVDNTDGVLKISGQYDFLELDYTNEKAYLLGYEIPLKQSGSTDDYVTKSTEQTISGIKRFSNPTYVTLLRDYSQSAHLLSFSNGTQFFGSPNHPMYLDSSSMVVEGQVRPTFKYYDDEYEQHEFAFLDDMPMKTITDTSVRIWDLESGTYILPNNCKIYYNGATNTTNYYNAQGDRTILEVNTSKAGTEKFFKFEYTTGSNAYYQYYVFTGMTTASNGYVKGVDLNARYPTGAVYISTNTTSPASLFGGSWEELGTDKALWLTSTSNANAGTTISAGLPNITGNWYARGVESGNGTASGAFSFSADGGNYGTGHTSGARGGFSFNAGNSNSIYGSSTTVQPPAYRVYAWRRIS